MTTLTPPPTGCLDLFSRHLTSTSSLSRVGEAALDTEVDGVLQRLGLSGCAGTLVGGDSGGVHVAGVSGGERRRLSIA